MKSLSFFVLPWIDLNPHKVKLRSVVKSRARRLLPFDHGRGEEEVRRKLKELKSEIYFKTNVTNTLLVTKRVLPSYRACYSF
jgi:hypothetical protein